VISSVFSFLIVIFIEKNVSKLEIVFGYYGGNVEANLNKENEKWLDMDGTKTVWLRILYNQKSSPAITHLKFMYMPFEGDHLV
jgi:hypothetical protein